MMHGPINVGLKENQPYAMEEETVELSVLRNKVGARELDNKRFRLNMASHSLQKK